MKVGLSNPCIAFGAVVLFVNCWNSSCSFFQANLHHWNLPALLLTAPPFHCSHVKANACTYTHIYIQYIWAPVKILYIHIWVVAIVMVIAFGGALSLSRVLWKSIFEIQHETKIHSLTGSEMDRAVVSLVSGASATLHVPFVLHLFGCIFLHVHFICMHLPFIVHSFPFIVLSCFCHRQLFISIHVPFIFLSF